VDYLYILANIASTYDLIYDGNNYLYNSAPDDKKVVVRLFDERDNLNPLTRDRYNACKSLVNVLYDPMQYNNQDIKLAWKYGEEKAVEFYEKYILLVD